MIGSPGSSATDSASRQKVRGALRAAGGRRNRWRRCEALELGPTRAGRGCGRASSARRSRRVGQGIADRDGDRQRLLALVRRLDQLQPVQRPAAMPAIGIGQASVVSAGRSASDRNFSRAEADGPGRGTGARCRRAPPEPLQDALQGMLRMSGRGDGAGAVDRIEAPPGRDGSRRPADHRAVRQPATARRKRSVEGASPSSPRR